LQGVARSGGLRTCAEGRACGKPLEGAGRVTISERMENWISRAIAWLMRKLMARLLRSAGQAPASTATSGATARPAIALQRDPLCGTHVSPEVSFPLEQEGQTLHFCSAECRARYAKQTRRSASPPRRASA